MKNMDNNEEVGPVLKAIGKDGQICRVEARISSCNAVKYSMVATQLNTFGTLNVVGVILGTARNFQSWR